MLGLAPVSPSRQAAGLHWPSLGRERRAVGGSLGLDQAGAQQSSPVTAALVDVASCHLI